MRVLIYKRTHVGDPDVSGRFGIHCCMGQVRQRNFDAVIGVGGISREPVESGIARRINWIGIGPCQIGVADDSYPILAFEHFYLKEEKGRLLSEIAPKLAKRLFAKNGPRSLMVESGDEIESLLKLAKTAPPSQAIFGRSSKPKSASRCNMLKKQKKSVKSN
jgi:hypothetical protein